MSSLFCLLTVLSVIESANGWDYVCGSGYFEIVTTADGFRIRLRDGEHQEIQSKYFLKELIFV
jgi:hypothetical protein